MALPSSWKVIVFTINLIVGLILSQVLGATMGKDAYKMYMEIVISATMWCLSFIMINVGYEFTIDKKALEEYGWDYLIAMTAAGFPWLFVALWFFFTLGTDIPMSEALLVARFSAPTSAGILFSMLDAAGLKDTWVFQKARILAIFDDLDTILLMIPLKVVLVGFKWELTIVIGIMVLLLLLAWFKLHAFRLPHSWPWTLLYAAIISFVCKMLHVVTHYHIDMEAIHIEVLLPAFVMGTIIDTPCARHELELQRKISRLRKAATQRRLDARLASTTGLGGSHAVVEPTTQTSDGNDSALRDSSKGIASISVTAVQPLPSSVTTVEPLPGSVIQDSDDGIKPTSADKHPASQDMNVAIRVAAVAPEGFRAADAGDKQQTPRTAWAEMDAGNVVSNPVPERRSARTASKQSIQSAGSIESLKLTRYGHVRSEVQKSRSSSKEDTVRIPPITEKKGLEPEAEPDPDPDEEESFWEAAVQTGISMVFMVLVGLSMPALVGKNAQDNSGGLSGATIVFHVILVSILMTIGKMFPVLCYREEAPVGHRTALCLGMCPRGEVGASIIVISLELGVEGPAIIIAMCALGGNLIMSGGFIASVKWFLRDAPNVEEEEIKDAGDSSRVVLPP